MAAAPPPPGASGEAIRAERLGKSWGATRAVDDVSFSVRRGEIFGFFGPNGAGKSTTIRVLCGLTAATAGTATVWGVDVARSPTEVRRHLTIVPEETAFYEKMTPASYLAFFARLAGRSKEGAREAVGRAAAVAEVTGFLGTRIKDLSHGQRQRVILARAFLSDAPLMVLDEPFQGIDIVHRKALREHLRRFAAAGNTVFFTSHNLIEAEHVVDRFAFLDRGRLVMEGTARELREKYLLPSFALRVSVPARAAKALAEALPVRECTVQGEEVHVTLLDPKDVPRIAAVLGGAGVAVLEMRQLGTMEEVFLRARQPGGPR
jgi:ABC-2 type transport system ATP-binding protein